MPKYTLEPETIIIDGEKEMYPGSRPTARAGGNLQIQGKKVNEAWDSIAWGQEILQQYATPL
jgi:hypothetical protein